MSLPDTEFVRYPFPVHVGVDPSLITSEGHARAISFYDGLIGIRPEGQAMGPTVVGLSAAGATIEQIADWYAGTPYENCVEKAYDYFGLATPDGLERCVSYAWRTGRFVVSREMHLPQPSAPELTAIPPTTLQILAGLTMQVDRSALDAWASAHGQHTAETALAALRRSLGLQNNAAAISLGFMTAHLYSREGKTVITNNPRPMATYSPTPFGRRAPARALHIAPGIDAVFETDEYRVLDDILAEQGQYPTEKLLKAPLSPTESLFNAPGSFAIRVDEQAGTAKLQIGGSVITFTHPDLDATALFITVGHLVGIEHSALAAACHLNPKTIGRKIRGYARAVDPQPDGYPPRGLVLTSRLIEHGLISFEGKTKHTVCLSTAQKRIFNLVSQGKVSQEMAAITGTHITGVNIHLTSLRKKFYVDSNEALLLAIKSSDIKITGQDEPDDTI